jgi:hypothetical protein
VGILYYNIPIVNKESTMKHLGYNLVIAALIIAPAVNLGFKYKDAVAESKIIRIASDEDVATLISLSPECGYEKELKAYLAKGHITIDEQRSLIALCEYNALNKANTIERNRRIYEQKIKRNGGLKI